MYILMKYKIKWLTLCLRRTLSVPSKPSCRSILSPWSARKMRNAIDKRENREKHYGRECRRNETGRVSEKVTHPINEQSSSVCGFQAELVPPGIRYDKNSGHTGPDKVDAFSTELCVVKMFHSIRAFGGTVGAVVVSDGGWRVPVFNQHTSVSWN